jgi:bifunctional DNA-binding transcriptional regulator/antitoxin component of YhaV-PrlF toxin-antitoxin module
MKDNNQILFPVTKGGKSGFIDSNGQVVIDFEFDGVSSFSEGLARIFIDEKVGFIDIRGNIVIPPKFDNALDFSEGLSVVTINDKKGYINKEGEIVIDPIFYMADHFENGIARVFKNIISDAVFINRQGNILLSGKNFLISKYSEGLINCSENGNWGYIDLDGTYVIAPTYNYTREFSEGKAAVIPKKNNNGKPNKKEAYGIIDKNNEMIISPIFQGSDIRFSEGLCAVWDDGYGYINDKGDITIPYEFELGQHFCEGLAVVKPKGKNKNYGYIDKSGNMIIKPIFTNAEDFKDGLASVTIGKEYEQFKYGYIDQKGNYIWEPTR